jgi:hypothetical protein
VVLQEAPDGRGADPVAELEQLALQPHISPARVLAPIRTTKAARTSSIGGCPVRFG